MFALDQAIAQWRQQMRTAGIKTPVRLDELESHLRDDVQQQLRSGLSVQQAFEAAVERVGPASALKAEFEKADETKRARERKLMERFVIGTVCLYSLFVGACVLFKLGSFSDTNLEQQISGLAATALTVLFPFSGRFAQRFYPAVPDKWIRTGIYVAGAVLLLIWLSVFYHLVMTRFEFPLSQLVVVILWAWTPMGALCGFIDGLERAASQKTVAAHS